MRTGKNIYQRKDGRWEARLLAGYTEAGKPRYKSLYAMTYSEARQKQRAAAGALPCGKPEKSTSKMTVATAADRWLSHVQLTAKESSFAKYARTVRQHVLPHIGGLEISRIDSTVVERFIAKLLTEGRLDGSGGLAPKTVQDVFVLLKSIFKHAKISCSFEGITLKKEDREIRVLSQREQDTLTEYLLQNADAKSIGIFLSLSTGIRIGELCALRWQDIDLKEKTLYVRHTLQRISAPSDSGAKTKLIMTTPKSKASIRDIPMTDFLVKTLVKAKKSDEIYLLSGTVRPLEPRTMQYFFKRCLADCKIADANFHALRHTFATRAVESGFELKSLSEILGHSNVNITLNKYVHSSFELKRSCMEKMSCESYSPSFSGQRE
jgi:integrase